MWKKVVQYCFLAAALYLGACANRVQLQGGEKDTDPPQIDSTATTPNLQTNFKKQRIETTFDEWVEVKDIFNQVIVSPPLEFEPEITVKGKTVRFDFAEEEVLKENATYTINFGDAIRDFTEGNIRPYNYVFSTGEFIDSLQVKGKAVDAFTGAPVEGALLMLYDNLADSVVRTEAPFYFVKTDKQGKFQINNVKGGTFKVFALVDNDGDKRYSQAEEKIGFLDDNFVLNDSTSKPISISLSVGIADLKMKKHDAKKYGIVKFIFNQKVDVLDIDYDDIGQTTYIEYDQDTVKFWYNVEAEKEWNLYLKKDDLIDDTIQVAAFAKDERLANKKLRLSSKSAQKINSLKPNDPIELFFNHPLSTIDESQIKVYEDTLNTLVVPQISIDEEKQNKLLLNFSWKEDISYRLEIMPEALTDFYGLANDTIIQTHNVLNSKLLSSINLIVKNVQPNTNYVLQLLSNTNSLIDQLSFQADSIYQYQFNDLSTSEFNLQIIEDTNGNKKWDPANYDKKTQAEKLYSRSLEKLRANWEQEIEFSLK